MESTTTRLSAILRAYVVFGALCVRFCVCDGEPSVVLDLCVITRDSVRYYLAIGVSSAGPLATGRDGTREGAASRVRAAVRKMQLRMRLGSSARVSRRRGDGVLQVGVSVLCRSVCGRSDGAAASVRS